MHDCVVRLTRGGKLNSQIFKHTAQARVCIEGAVEGPLYPTDTSPPDFFGSSMQCLARPLKSRSAHVATQVSNERACPQSRRKTYECLFRGCTSYKRRMSFEWNRLSPEEVRTRRCHAHVGNSKSLRDWHTHVTYQSKTL